ncbi:MAG: carbohydrate ABC transporter permease [Spirochaetales bacterium]|nr:carbohydrate ABC transporter permease [Spirochaetales bacterium]
MKIITKSKNIVLNVLIVGISTIFFTPGLVIFINSLKTKQEARILNLSLPEAIKVINYQEVIERGKLISSFLNSALYSIGGVILILCITTAGAYVLSRNKTKLNQFIYFFIVLGIAMPINYIALMKVMQFTNLINTRIGMIILYTGLNIPISLFIAYGFIGNIPRELDEAAILDGCSSIELFYKIIFPLLKPVIATLAVLNFMGIWNDFIMPLYYLNASSKWPMTLAVYNFFGMFQHEWNLVCADIVLTSIPVLIVYLLGQKYIVDGMVSGSVKG